MVERKKDRERERKGDRDRHREREIYQHCNRYIILIESVYFLTFKQ